MSAPAGPEFGPAHHVLLNGLAFLAAGVFANDDRIQPVACALTEALPHATRETPRTAALCGAVAEVLAALPSRAKPGMVWAGAMLEAERVLTAIFYWRTAMAQDGLRQTLAPGPEDIPK